LTDKQIEYKFHKCLDDKHISHHQHSHITASQSQIQILKKRKTKFKYAMKTFTYLMLFFAAGSSIFALPLAEPLQSVSAIVRRVAAADPRPPKYSTDGSDTTGGGDRGGDRNDRHRKGH
jgi:hypothetical protein